MHPKASSSQGLTALESLNPQLPAHVHVYIVSLPQENNVIL